MPVPSHVQSAIIEAVKSEDLKGASSELRNIGMDDILENKFPSPLQFDAARIHAGGGSLFKMLVSEYLGTDVSAK